MSERAIEVKVGILVTVCLALLVAFVVLLGDLAGGDGGRLYLDVPTSADLKPGAAVKVAGVPAGRVREVRYLGGELDEATGRRVWVRVELRVDEAFLGTIRKDAQFYITTQGLLGEKYVEVDPGSEAAEALRAGDVVEGLPPLRMEIMALNANALISSLTKLIRGHEAELSAIITNANDTVRMIRDAVSRLDAMVAREEANVAEVIEELKGLEAQAQTLLASANAAIGDGTSVRAAITNIEGLSAEARGQIRPLVADARAAVARYGELADGASTALAEVRTRLDGALEGVDAVIATATRISERIDRGEGTIGALLHDMELYDDIREMMKDLKRHPWKFLWKE